jgi:hypothetical protein
MKPSTIQIGKTYRNRGKGLTTRTVLDIGVHVVPPSWYSESSRPHDPGVRYLQEKKEHFLYLSSFAAWCGSEVT